MMGATKAGEYERSAEFFADLCKQGDRGPYYALAMLLDSQYERSDMIAVLKCMERRENRRKQAQQYRPPVLP